MSRDVFITALFLFVTLLALTSSAVEIVAGRATLASPTFAGTPTFETVGFSETYTSPLVFTMPDDGAASESGVRIVVNSTSFDIAHVVPDNSTTSFTRTEIDYLVVEDGNYSVGGAQVFAGSVDTQTFQSKFNGPGSGWVSVAFPAMLFSTTPSVLTQIQTMNNETTTGLLSSPSRPWMTVAVRNVSATGMEVALDRAETTTGSITTNETIGFVAFEAGTATFNDGTNDIDFEALVSSDTVTDACTATTLSLGGAPDVIGIASQITRDGADGGWVRRCALSPTQIQVKIQEDIATDTDTGHTTERVSILVFSAAFSFANGGSPLEANVVPFSLFGAASLAPTTVSFGATFDSIPRVFVLPTDEEFDSASIRILAVTATQFTMAQVQPDGSPAPAASMHVDYIASVDGIHALDDDTIVDVGILSVFSTVSAGSGDTYTDLDFAYQEFGTSPVTLLQIQTTNSQMPFNPSTTSDPWLEVAAISDNDLTMSVSLERAEVTDSGFVASEDIAYMAVTNTALGSFEPVEGTTISFETLRPTNIRGVDDGCDTSGFLATYIDNPIVGASQSTRVGGNGGWVKRCSLSNTLIGLHIDEDTDTDTERAHTTEDVDVLVFSGAFAGNYAQPDLTVAFSSNVATPSPASIVEYSILVSNAGAARAINIELSASTSRFTGLKMDTYPGGEPFLLTPGGVDPEVILGIPTYTEDEGTDAYTYTPVGPIDSNVTDFRIPVTGKMPSAATFTVRYQILVE
jgi:hypothetical protein